MSLPLPAFLRKKRPEAGAPSPHAKRFASPSGASRQAPAGLSAVVIGGGLAGLAAATVLAERGVKTTLLEREATLGGRLASWPITLPDGARLEMERGFHAFFRQYYNVRQMMRRWDPALSHLVPLRDYPILGPGGELLRFDRLPRRPPWNVAAAALRARHWLTLRDLTKVDIGRALAMVSASESATLTRDRETAKAYLDGLNFPPEARRMLFDVFAHSFFNPEETMSAAELLMMFRYYFTANPEGLVFDVLDEPFSASFIGPWARHLELLGVTLATGTAAQSIQRRDRGFAVETAAGPHLADLVVLATEVPGLHALAKTSDVFSARDRTRLESLDVTAPFAVWRLFLDRPAAAHRDPFAGTAGLGRLDNISIYERLEGESRRYLQSRGGPSATASAASIVELHAYGLDTPLDEDALKAELRAGLDRLYPELAGARVLHDEWLVRQDCPAFPPGSYTSRPTVETDTAGLTLAGDFVRLPFPSALMERAVTSGIHAANILLSAHRVEPEPLWHL